MAIDAGIVSAYGFAVAHGYTGTPEQFGEDQANFAANAQQVREDKEDVEDLKDEVQDLVDSIPPDYTTTVEKVDSVTDIIGNLFSDSEAMGGATGITRASASEYVGTASAFQTFLLNNYTLDETAEAYTIAFDIYTEANSSSSGTGLEVQYGNHSSKSTLTSFDNDQTDPYHFESFFSVTYAPTVADRTLGLVFKANSAPNNIWHISNIRLFEGMEIPDAVTAKDTDAREKVDEAVKDLEDLKSSINTGNNIQNDIIDFVDLIPKADGEWEQGTINTTTGEKTDSNYRVRTKSYVILQNGKQYTFKNIYDEFSIALFAYNSSGVFQSCIRSYINYDFIYRNTSGVDYYVLFVIMRKNESPYNPLPVSEIITNGWYGYENGTLLSENLNNVKTRLRGLDTDILSFGMWEQGGYAAIANYSAPGQNTSSTRIRTEVTIAKGNYTIKPESQNFAYVWAAFDSNGNNLGSNAGWQTGEKTFNLTTDTGLLRIAIKKSTDANIVPSEFTISGIFAIKNGELIKLSDLQKYISENTNTPIKLKVMTYNIGRFSYGVSPYYLSENYDTKLANYKAFFSDQKADIVGLQECNTYLDTADATGGSHSANDEIFTYLYPDNNDISGFTCLKSKYILANKGVGRLTENGRQYVYANIEISGKTIFVMSVHLTPNAGAEQEAQRATERAAIIDILNQHDYAICFGDFNAQTGTDFDDFTDEGYKIANGGYLPIKDTYGGRYNFEEQNPMDNIVVTPNIIIDDSKRQDVFADLSSDHVPYVAWLTIT